MVMKYVFKTEFTITVHRIIVICRSVRLNNGIAQCYQWRPHRGGGGGGGGGHLGQMPPPSPLNGAPPLLLYGAHPPPTHTHCHSDVSLKHLCFASSSRPYDIIDKLIHGYRIALVSNIMSNTKRKLSGAENRKCKLQRQLHSSAQSVPSHFLYHRARASASLL